MYEWIVTDRAKEGLPACVGRLGVLKCISSFQWFFAMWTLVKKKHLTWLEISSISLTRSLSSTISSFSFLRMTKIQSPAAGQVLLPPSVLEPGLLVVLLGLHQSLLPLLHLGHQGPVARQQLSVLGHHLHHLIPETVTLLHRDCQLLG